MGATPTIFNIQRFSTHDGPGIRTTVFFKGCPLRCAWCHNPESQSYAPELLVDSSRCTGCGMCIEACPEGAIALGEDGRARLDRDRCRVCGECVDLCAQGCREVAGEPAAEPRELVEQLLRDRSFFERSGGGVTLSGGECLAQEEGYLAELCSRLHARGIRVAIDTCGDVPWERIERLLPDVDLWLYDIKAADDGLHRRLTGSSNTRIWDNLGHLARSGAAVRVRMPLVSPVNDDMACIDATIRLLLERVGTVPVSLLPYHAAGNGKYRRLDRVPRGDFRVPADDELVSIRDRFLDAGFSDVEIGG